tara:strand:+ start:1536 stop:1811 length:276 start_codon:yes stop_codon:yes gene_type:complete
LRQFCSREAVEKLSGKCDWLGRNLQDFLEMLRHFYQDGFRTPRVLNEKPVIPVLIINAELEATEAEVNPALSEAGHECRRKCTPQRKYTKQ